MSLYITSPPNTADFSLRDSKEALLLLLFADAIKYRTGLLAVRQLQFTTSSPCSRTGLNPPSMHSIELSKSIRSREESLFVHVLSAVTCNYGSQQRSQSFSNGTKPALSISPVTAALKCRPIALATNHTTVPPTHRASC